MDENKVDSSTPHKRSKSVPGMSTVVLNDTQLQTQPFMGRLRSNTAGSVERPLRTQRNGARLSSGGLLRNQSKKRRNKNTLEKSRSVDVTDLDRRSNSSRKSSNSSQSSDPSDENQVPIRERKQGFCLPSVNSLVEKLKNMEDEQEFPNNIDPEQTNPSIVYKSDEKTGSVDDQQLKSTILLQDKYERSKSFGDEEQYDNSCTSYHADEVQEREKIYEQTLKSKKESTTNIRRRSLPGDLSEHQIDSYLGDCSEGHEYREISTNANQTDMKFQNKQTSVYKNRCQNKWKRWHSLPEYLYKVNENKVNVSLYTSENIRSDDRETSLLVDPVELSNMQEARQSLDNENAMGHSNENQTERRPMEDNLILEQDLSNNEENSDPNNEKETNVGRSGKLKRSYSLPLKFDIVDKDERQGKEIKELRRTKSLSTDVFGEVLSDMMSERSAHLKPEKRVKGTVKDQNNVDVKDADKKPKRLKERKERKRAKSLPVSLALAEIPEESPEDYDGYECESIEDMAKKHINKAFQELLRKIRTSQAPRHVKVKRSRSLSTIKEISVVHEPCQEDEVVTVEKTQECATEQIITEEEHEEFSTEHKFTEHEPDHEDREVHVEEQGTTKEEHEPHHEENSKEQRTTEKEQETHNEENSKEQRTTEERESENEEHAKEQKTTAGTTEEEHDPEHEDHGDLEEHAKVQRTTEREHEEEEEHATKQKNTEEKHDEHAGSTPLQENAHGKDKKRFLQSVREELQEEYENNANELDNLQPHEQDFHINKEGIQTDKRENEQLQTGEQSEQEIHGKNEQIQIQRDEQLYGKLAQCIMLSEPLNEHVNVEKSNIQKAKEELHIEIPQIFVSDVGFEQCQQSAVDAEVLKKKDEIDQDESSAEQEGSDNKTNQQTEELKSPDEEDIQGTILEHIHNMDFATFDPNINQRSLVNVLPCMERIPEDPDKETWLDSEEFVGEKSTLKRAGSIRRGRRKRGQFSSSNNNSKPQLNNQSNRDQKRVSWSADTPGVTKIEGEEVAYLDEEDGYQDQYEPGPRGDITFIGSVPNRNSSYSEDNASGDDFEEGPIGDLRFTGLDEERATLDASDYCEPRPNLQQSEEFDIDPMESKFDGLLRKAINSYLEPDYSQSASPIHQAVALGSIAHLRKLIEDGADVNCQDEHGWPPLHVATLFNHVDCAAILLEAGADLQGYTESLIDEYHTIREKVC